MARFSPLRGSWRRGKSTSIFLSYRRDDAAGYAGRIYDGLSAHFGRDNVFIDVDAIAPGVDYYRRIDEVLNKCNVMLVLIGSKWVAASLPDGSRRLSDPNDLVRHEIASGLQRDITVMPLLVQNTPMPEPDVLPEPLQPLTRRNAFELSDNRWNYDLKRLVAALDDAGGSTIFGTRWKRLRLATVLPVVLAVLVLITAWFATRPDGRTNSPSTTLTEKNASRLIFSDNLAAASGRWSTTAEGACIQYFSKGAYRLQVKGQFNFCAEDTNFNSELASLKDARVEVNAVWTRLPKRNLSKFGAGGIALRCRAVGDAQSGSSYSASFSPIGNYQLVRFESGRQVQLATGATSALVMPLGTERRLRLDCMEQSGGLTVLRFYVDGRLIKSFADRSGLADGAVGIEVDNFDTEPVEAQFRQLRIYGP